MNLYILRHGIAVEPGTPGFASDADRPLTPKGKRKLREIGRAMAAMDLSFDGILSSPYLRARQTAEIIAKVLDCQQRLELTDNLVPSGDPAKLIAHLNHPGSLARGARARSGKAHKFQDVLLVGHEPYLSMLVSLLISGSSRAGIILKKGGLGKLSTDSLKPGRCAQLEWLLTPSQLARLS